MKKWTVFFFSSALLVFVCVFAKEDRAGGQAKAGRSEEKNARGRSASPMVDKEKFARK